MKKQVGTSHKALATLVTGMLAVPMNGHVLSQQRGHGEGSLAHLTHKVFGQHCVALLMDLQVCVTYKPPVTATTQKPPLSLVCAQVLLQQLAVHVATLAVLTLKLLVLNVSMCRLVQLQGSAVGERPVTLWALQQSYTCVKLHVF